MADLDWRAALAAGPDNAQQVAGMVEAAVQRAVNAAIAQGFEPLRSPEDRGQSLRPESAGVQGAAASMPAAALL